MIVPPPQRPERPVTPWLKGLSLELGFSQVGVCPAVEPPGNAKLDAWLAAGYAGRMEYIADRRAAYAHPAHVLEGCRSLVMLGMDYRTEDPRPPGPTEGRVSRYAWGSTDYHHVIRDRLHALADALRQRAPGALVRGVVDTAPLMERDFARLAGLGWIGKNTLLINRQRGSYFFLAALLTDLVLDYDTPHATDHCGTCTACLDACPTGAFAQPYVLDATRCISYLTIELRDHIPAELRPGMGAWVFGCDVCQDVCPWNRRAPLSETPELLPTPGMNPIDLLEVLGLDETAFRARFRETPLWRAHRGGLLRSAAIALGNASPPEALPVLQRAAADPDPLVSAAARWALDQYGERGAEQE